LTRNPGSHGSRIKSGMTALGSQPWDHSPAIRAWLRTLDKGLE
jgi:hypothetical protein